MPIVYAQPDPMSPAISSQYGAAQQFSQDAPSIIGARTAAARMQQDAQQEEARLALSRQVADAQAQDRRAALYTGSQIAQADRQQQAMNVGAALENRLDLQSMEGQQRIAQIQEHAAASEWLNRQDMTQREAMRLQKLKAAVDEVKSSRLSPEMKDAAILKLRTEIDPLEMRMKQTMTRQAEMRGQMMEAEMARAKRVELQNQQFEAEAKKQGMGILMWADPETGKPHPLIQNPKTGVWYNPLSGGTGGASSAAASTVKPFDVAEARKQAEARAAVEYTPDGLFDPSTGKKRDTAEQIARREARVSELVQQAERAHNASNNPQQQQAQQQEQPRPDLPPGLVPGRTAVESLENTRDYLNERIDDPKTRRVFNTAIEDGIKMLVKSKGYANMTPDEKVQYDGHSRTVSEIMKSIAPPDQSARAAGQAMAVPPNAGPPVAPRRSANPFNVGPLRRLNPFN